MLGDISGLEKIYIVCGYTDYPRSIIIRGNAIVSEFYGQLDETS